MTTTIESKVKADYISLKWAQVKAACANTWNSTKTVAGLIGFAYGKTLLHPVDAAKAMKRGARPSAKEVSDFLVLCVTGDSIDSHVQLAEAVKCLVNMERVDALEKVGNVDVSDAAVKAAVADLIKGSFDEDAMVRALLLIAGMAINRLHHH